MKKLVVGLAGCGFAGSVHSRALALIKASNIALSVGIEQRICVDSNSKRAELCASQYGWQKSSTDLNDLFKEKLDALIIALPNSEHLSLIQRAHNFGLYVLLEKPLSNRLSEAKAIVQIAEKSQRVCLAYVNRFVPAVFEAKKAIKQGAIGEVRTIRSTYLLNMRKPTGPADWRFDYNRAGNGVSDDLGSHHIDLIRHLVSDFDQVFGVTKRWNILEAPDTTNEDLLMAVYTLKNGAYGTMVASRTTPGHPLTGFIEIDGTEGSLKIDRNFLNELFVYDVTGTESKMKVRPPDSFAGLWASPTVQGLHTFSWYDCFAFQMAEFVRVSAGLQPKFEVSANLHDGLRSLEIVDQMVNSDNGPHMVIV